ncbi:hypothetical protein FRB93_000552 [Tulasnella sp. JGI-2019a]|nr:hypothetical protein FRB93_000552 [Tulasnella sp. JGI-2019a]
MAGDLPLDVAHLLGFGASMFLYGWYACMFQKLIRGLWARRRRSRVVVWVTISLFVVTTVNLALCVVDDYNAWIKYRVSPGIEIYYGLETWTAIRPMQYILLNTAATIADILVCWRLYAIFDKNLWVVIFPAVLLVVDIGVGFTVCFTSIAIRSNSGGAKYNEFFIIGDIINTGGTLLVNIFSTSLIITRLWWVGRRTRTNQGRSIYNSVIISMIQSGALYTVSLLLFTLFSLVNYMGAGAFMKYILVMVIAISPLLIVMQLNQKFLSQPDGRDDKSENTFNGASNTRHLAFGPTIKRGSKETKFPPAGRLILSPIDTIELETCQSSDPNGSHQTHSHTSGRGSVDRPRALVTVSNFANPKDDLRLRLQSDADTDAEKGSYVNTEEDISPLPSPKFARDLDYLPGDENYPDDLVNP